jgi:hypothetical protein
MTQTNIYVHRRSLVQFTFASPTEKTEMLVTRLKQKLGAPLKIGVGRFEALFEAVDIAGEVADLPRKVLLESLGSARRHSA